ncbi:MAG: N-6 DNA methylase [Verrucomicrobiae bacterium]|nr:N-6 DNA methylase [Verrucomicrobiae bacterium]
MPTMVHTAPPQVLRSHKERSKQPTFTIRDATQRKANGIHYTPPLLAAYLAQQVVSKLKPRLDKIGQISVLDPACGDGNLLKAIVDATPHRLRAKLALTGFDTDAEALQKAENNLSGLDIASVDLRCVDFLSTFSPSDLKQQMDFQFTTSECERLQSIILFDAIISNPPYVRTQILGSAAAHELTLRFGLTGRVDLYHAFVKAMTLALQEGGVLGLLTSNRFLSVQSGTSMRKWLTSHFQLQRLVDLGDTKLFKAAVLPAVLIALRQNGVKKQSCEFIRVYETPKQNGVPQRNIDSVLEVLDGSFSGYASASDLCFHVQTGHLQTAVDGTTPWTMSNKDIDAWLSTVKAHTSGVFSDIAKVCVGIKTTADAVFMRDDWDALPEAERPEDELLHPLITHHLASRWHPSATATEAKRVLYPYSLQSEERVPVDLANYPRAQNYLYKHRERLQNRSYLIESGRRWYEIWVPHHPADWTRPKIAFPDISETSKFFLVKEGWIVNGDCYWTKLLPGKPNFWLHIMLAIANSSFIHKFYDVTFHNKLYAGRRRFMSQYVRLFPLPKLERAKHILDLMPQLLRASSTLNTTQVACLQRQLDGLVWQAFGLAEEIAR